MHEKASRLMLPQWLRAARGTTAIVMPAGGALTFEATTKMRGGYH